ncbi:hypothetical protein VTL71DRAFT_12710 [Oculimacula yallundae]|uniref:Uncharacterized protein n=1 Tax=Oculimacula yallundae TaxID=86028 RepID=A0ABR4CNG4_9HELO
MITKGWTWVEWCCIGNARGSIGWIGFAGEAIRPSGPAMHRDEGSPLLPGVPTVQFRKCPHNGSIAAAKEPMIAVCVTRKVTRTTAINPCPKEEDLSDDAPPQNVLSRKEPIIQT